MSLKKTIFLFLYIQLNVTALISENNNPLKQVSNEYVYQMSQDPLGYIWLATGNGLIKMDAEHCYPQTIKNKNSAEKTIVHTVLHSKNTTWFTDKNGAIFCSNNGVIKKVYSPFKNKVISSFELDKDKVAFVSDSKGIFVLNTKTKKGKLFSLKHKQISDIYLYNNILWISHEEGISKYKYLKNTLKEVNKYKVGELVSSILPLSDNEILLATNTKKGLLLLKTIPKQIVAFKPKLYTFSSSIKNLYKDSYSNIWVSTFGEGVVKFEYSSTKGYTKSTLINNYNNQDYLYCNQVMEDYQKNIWIATYGKGVFSIPNNYISTFKFNKQIEGIETFSKNGPNLYYAIRNKIYLETSNEQKTTVSLSTNEVIKKIALDKQNSTIFIGTEESGLYIYNLKQKKIVKLILSEDKLSNHINDLLIQENNIWVATYDGLFELDLNGKVVNKYSTKNGLRHNLITCLEVSADGSLLFGSKSNKLFYLKNGIMKEQNLPISNQIVTVSSIKCNNITGIILVGTLGHGIFVVNKSKIKHFNSESGLTSDYILEVNELQNTHILIFSNQEFSILNLNTNKVSTIQKCTAENEFYFINNSIIHNNKEVIFGTNKGLYIFDINKYLSGIKAPKPSYLKLLLDGKTFDETKLVSTIVLNKDNHKIQFNFNCIQFSNKGKVTFFYKLEGHDNHWIETKNKSAIYNQLNYGNYTFHLKICSENECEEKSYPFDIAIEKPFWKSVWFYASLTFALFSILVVLFITRDEKNKIKSQLLKTKILLKNQELEIRKNDFNNSLEYTKIFVKALKSKLPIINYIDFELFTASKHQNSISSDMCWYDKSDSKLVFALIDTQQVDILGGMASIWLSEILNNAFTKVKIHNPKLLMQHLQESIENKLGTSSFNHKIKATIGSINLENLEFTFCSINQSVVIINQNNNEEVIYGKNTFLGQNFDNSAFDNHSFDLKKISSIYFITDGYETLNQLGLTSFISIFKSVNQFDAKLQKEKINIFLESEKNKPEQKYDDLTILGIKMNR